jgi:transposase
MFKLPSLGEMDSSLPHPGARVYLCTARADMRKGFDSLAHLVREHLGCDPLSGDLFLFVGRGADRLKILYWDADGYAVWYKRLEEGSFRLPRFEPGQSRIQVKASELAMLLEGIDLKSIKRTRRFSRTAPEALVPGVVPGAGAKKS